MRDDVRHSPARHGDAREVPAVSVCVPAYQGARFIGATVESVLAQTFTDFELVVLDNGSTDGTSDVVRSFDDPRIRLERREETVPLSENWNRVVRLGRAPLVKLLCADDVLLPRALELQVEALRTRADAALAAGRVDLLDPSGRVLFRNRFLGGLTGVLDAEDVVRRIVRHGGNPIGPPVSVTFRRADFDAVGGFDPDENFLGDLLLWSRLLRHGRLVGFRESLGGFRIHPGSLSGEAGKAQFRAQRAFTAALSGDDRWAVRRSDALVGGIGAYGALARRHALFVLSGLRELLTRAPARRDPTRAEPAQPAIGAAPDAPR
ncbi:MAG: glycosyltransferase [Pseudonocardia sp.]|nr:glycosyltransferase [Pseudonocardia sp.]